MAATVSPVAGADDVRPLSVGHLFLADSRTAFLLLNEARHRCLHSLFGVSREQENALTFVLLLGAASGTYEGARRVVRAPLRIGGFESATGGVLLREAAFGVAGPSARATPLFGTLVAGALAGGLALPWLRRTAHAARATERRLREHRIAQYLAAARPTAPPAATPSPTD